MGELEQLRAEVAQLRRDLGAAIDALVVNGVSVPDQFRGMGHVARLEADVARLRALLREGRGHHGAAGMFCVRGTLEDGTPCPTCDWVRRVDAELAPPGTPA